MAQKEEAKQAAAAVWGCSPDQVMVQDVSLVYQWARKHTLFLAQDPARRRMMIAVAPDGSATAFNDPADIKPLNLLLQREQVGLPDGMSKLQLALTIRTLLLGPGGFVGSQPFWDEQKSALEMWTSPSPEDGPALFEKHCQDPLLNRSDEGWELTFSYFNSQGGVEKWHASGNAQSIKSAVRETVVPEKTFLFPYG
ncbi:MAG TPA: hypothetical protein VGB17_17490 [Pyrinomonadaceae bacterium]|jgi:hypothetical protein